jgi:hypothetical protein
MNVNVQVDQREKRNVEFELSEQFKRNIMRGEASSKFYNLHFSANSTQRCRIFYACHWTFEGALFHSRCRSSKAEEAPACRRISANNFGDAEYCDWLNAGDLQQSLNHLFL